MSLFRRRIAMGAACAWLLHSSVLAAQSSGSPAAPSTDGDRMQMLEQRIDRLAENLASAQAQVEQDRAKMQAMQAEIDDLRKGLAESGKSPAPEVQNAAVQLQQAVEEIREQQEVISSQVKQHDQTKIESASKLPVRLHGLVLFNAFVNQGVVDQPDLPTSALARFPGRSHGSAGAGVRQTLLGLDGTGPMLWNGRLLADVSLDFWGGVTDGALSAPAGVVRMRTAGISWQWPNDLLRAGYDGPLISPLSPTSFATVAQPALAWSGNLWTWAPQIRWQHLFPLADNRHAGFEFGLYDPAYADDSSNQAYRSVSPGEAARQPGYESRISYRAGKDATEFVLGAAGYYDRKNYGAGQTVDTWAGAADWRVPASRRGNLSGEFYRGRGIGSLGGGAYRDTYSYLAYRSGIQKYKGLDAIGGWTQWQWNFLETIQLNAVFGQDTGYADELRYGAPQQTANVLYYYARNRSLMANFIYRPWSSFLLSPEFRRLESWPINGELKTANVYTLTAGYEF
ncbi:MAG TPA: hypothetical protein VLZ50_04620 [Terracidiphilus sp.]|nr:hypothetical protein [Terracidiphilus sp.]